MRFLAYYLRKVGFELFKMQARGLVLILQSLFHSRRNGSADHGVLTLSISELARVCDLSRTTVYKYLSLLEG